MLGLIPGRRNRVRLCGTDPMIVQLEAPEPIHPPSRFFNEHLSQ